MADTVPAPVLDTRNGDALLAEILGSFPAELSDHSDSNPATVIAEACAALVDFALYQINQWPQAVIQYVLSLCGITINPATAAAVQQTFRLTAPQATDTIVPTGTAVATSDGETTFETDDDLTIAGYTVPTGTVYIAAGSTALTGIATTFLTDVANGDQISTDATTWYTVQNVIDNTHLTLSTSWTGGTIASGSAVAYYEGPVSGTTSATATVTGVDSNVSAGELTVLQSSIPGVSSTSNAAAATGGADAETVTAAKARAPLALAARDVACSADDFRYFAQQILGQNSRAYAQANYNGTVATQGYVTVALLSSSYTVATPVTAQERANVVRDLAGRYFSGATLVDAAANIQQFDTVGSGSSTVGTRPAAIIYRVANNDSNTVKAAVGGAINSYLNPATYSWGRTIYTSDLVQVVEAASGVDRVLSINGRLAVGMNYTLTSGTLTFTLGSTTATLSIAGDSTPMLIGASSDLGQTFIIDSVNNKAYLLVNKAGATLTLDRAAEATATIATCPWFTSMDTALSNWYSLPYSQLGSTTATAPASIVIVGSV
jgi:uncharacterized phage protein gp47/JayE